MTSFWKSSSRDKALNGTLLGGLFAAGIVFGEKVIDFVTTKIPENWMLIDNTTLNISLYIIGAGALIGFIIDKY